MTDISSKIRSLYTLEELAAGDTLLHRLHPGAKLLGCLVYLLCLISLGRYDLGRMAPFLFYPVVMLALGEIPPGLVLRRVALALPFCLFGALSNLLLDRQVLYQLGPLPVTGGLLSAGGILCKALLSVSAVLCLIALTPFPDLTEQLRRFHVPGFLVSLFEMTYRYIGTLLEEAGTMSTAYQLRAPEKRALDMGHMGPFVGSLLLRSFDRAERIYQAMLLRGYGAAPNLQSKPMTGKDWGYLLLVAGSSLVFRRYPLTALLGGLLC